jgi:hypothetical protein
MIDAIAVVSAVVGLCSAAVSVRYCLVAAQHRAVAETQCNEATQHRVSAQRSALAAFTHSKLARSHAARAEQLKESVQRTPSTPALDGGTFSEPIKTPWELKMEVRKKMKEDAIEKDKLLVPRPISASGLYPPGTLPAPTQTQAARKEQNDGVIPPSDTDDDHCLECGQIHDSGGRVINKSGKLVANPRPCVSGGSY